MHTAPQIGKKNQHTKTLSRHWYYPSRTKPT